MRPGQHQLSAIDVPICAPRYLPSSPADLEDIEYGKHGYDHKCKRDEVVIES
jgi:hypothetical protein